jgi:hypothetical protein
VAWHGGVMILVEGEVAPGRRNRGDDDSWANTNLTNSKIKKIHALLQMDGKYLK